jgi:proteasome accessory factor BC
VSRSLAKDTEKLIRQLSLISYLMAERRPVTATEIRRDVEGYSDMTEDAFARRFYADRAELDALGIHLTVDKPVDGFSEQENYSLTPEAFHLPPIAFTDSERAALQTALTLLDGEFAYAEPLRLALQQIAWGRPSPLGSDSRQTIGLGITASAGGGELSSRLAKIDTAIYRRKRIEFEYHTMQSDATALRKVDPYHLLFEGGQFYLVGYAHEREAIRVFRLSRIQGKVAYATKAEHDFSRPEDFDPRVYASRIPWQLGAEVDVAEVEVPDGVLWYVERQYGAYGTFEGNVFRTPYALDRLLISWALSFGLRILGPGPLVEEARRRIDLLIDGHRGEPAVAVASGLAPEPVAAVAEANGRSRGGETTIRPERFARLVTLASVLIAAGRAGEILQVRDVCEQLKMSPQELREDVSVLNVVNFGGGAYVIYADVRANGEIEVDPEPYSDTFDRAARLLPIEANALVAAIDLIGAAHPDLRSAREKVVEALGFDPADEGLQIVSPRTEDAVTHSVELAVHESRLLDLEYWTQAEDRYSERLVEPYALFNGKEAWYVAAWDVDLGSLRHFRLDRVKTARARDEHFERREGLNPMADIGGWPRTGTVGGSRVARVLISTEQARWAREQRTVLAELPDGRIIVEITFKGIDFLVREVLKEAGDAVVLEPADAREAVLAAAEGLVARAT